MQDDATGWAWPWWTVMVLVNLMNLIACARVLARTRGSSADPASRYRDRMRIMGVVFTVVGAYRSVFVCSYVTRMAWFDTLANSALLIRLLAVFAELSFSGQFAFAMARVNCDLSMSPAAGAPMVSRLLVRRAPWFMWSCIFLAQIFATASVITRSKLLSAIEETLWAVGFLSVLPLAVMQFRRASAVRDSSGRFDLVRTFTRVSLSWCAIYCTWALAGSLPFWIWPGALTQMRTGCPPVQYGLLAVREAFTVVHESKAWGCWGGAFLFWHSAYFSLCVWISIFLMNGPRARRPAVDSPGSQERLPADEECSPQARR
jgi:hypothetical protein